MFAPLPSSGRLMEGGYGEMERGVAAESQMYERKDEREAWMQEERRRGDDLQRPAESCEPDDLGLASGKKEFLKEGTGCSLEILIFF